MLRRLNHRTRCVMRAGCPIWRSYVEMRARSGVGKQQTALISRGDCAAFIAARVIAGRKFHTTIGIRAAIHAKWHGPCTAKSTRYSRNAFGSERIAERGGWREIVSGGAYIDAGRLGCRSA